MSTVTMVGFAVTIGAFHVAAWNFYYPTDADMWVWRISSVVSCTLLLVVVPVLEAILEKVPGYFDSDGNALLMSCFGLYIGTRAILAVEMIRLLFFIPPEGFLVTWVDSVPHL